LKFESRIHYFRRIMKSVKPAINYLLLNISIDQEIDA